MSDDPIAPSGSSDPRDGLRALARHQVRVGCWVQVAGRDLLGVGTNISRGGILVRIPHDQASQVLEPGTRVRLRVQLGEGQEGFSCDAEVAWSDRDSAVPVHRTSVLVGIRFSRLSNEDPQKLSAFLDRVRFTVLLIDEDPEYSDTYAELSQHYRVVRCSTAEEGNRILREQEVAVVLVDQLRDRHCLDWFHDLSERWPQQRVSRVVLSDFTVAGQMQELVNVGRIFAWVRKPFSAEQLLQLVHRAVDAFALKVENELLRNELERANNTLRQEQLYLRQRSIGHHGFERIVGSSRAVLALLDQTARIKRSVSTVHLLGETGTGKELVARALHEGGPRADRPFVPFNCAGLNDQLLQSTLFGHRKGAFTGADRDQRGLFEQAHGGTLFLDEIAELSLQAQASLLRALQEEEITPLGATRPTHVDCRLISATHKDLREAVKQGRFREDLYFRLVVISLSVPPLRERTGDVPILATHFLDVHCEANRKNVRGFTTTAMRALERYPWPGNVRELENEVERLVVLAEDGQKIPLELLSVHLRVQQPSTDKVDDPAVEGIRIPLSLQFDDAIALLERGLLTGALQASAWNVTRAAQSLRMERSRLAKLRVRYRLDPETP